MATHTARASAEAMRAVARLLADCADWFEANPLRRYYFTHAPGVALGPLQDARIARDPNPGANLHEFEFSAAPVPVVVRAPHIPASHRVPGAYRDSLPRMVVFPGMSGEQHWSSGDDQLGLRLFERANMHFRDSWW